MANLYFCQSGRCLGILRAVLSSEECTALLSHDSAHYIGQQFPLTNQDPADFALLRIFDEEADDDWRAGFYLLDADIMRVEEALRCSAAKPSAKLL
jgi:hypothetical protein